jgi:hypothetical protein
VGSDILRVMDTPRSLTNSLAPNRADLELMVNRTDAESFYRNFTAEYLCNPNAVAKEISVECSDIQIDASVWYMNKSSTLGSYLLANSGNNLGIGPGVRVTHWIHTDYRPAKPIGMSTAEWNQMWTEPQEVLVEVLIWKA